MCYLFAICFVCLSLSFFSLFFSHSRIIVIRTVCSCPFVVYILCVIAHRAHAEHRLCNTKLWEQQCDQSQIKTRIFRKFKRKISGAKTVREGICCTEYYQQQSTGKTIDFIITGATTLSVHKSITRITLRHFYFVSFVFVLIVFFCCYYYCTIFRFFFSFSFLKLFFEIQYTFFFLLWFEIIVWLTKFSI